MKGGIGIETPNFWEAKYRVQFFKLFADGNPLAAIDDRLSLFIYTTDDQNLELTIRLTGCPSSIAVSKDSESVLVRLVSGRMAGLLVIM
jgi:hypothetical protein